LTIPTGDDPGMVCILCEGGFLGKSGRSKKKQSGENIYKEKMGYLKRARRHGGH
jgi:hypothetical protein